MRTLLITSSYDATSDLLIAKMGSQKYIRLNFDRPRDWCITLSESELLINSDNEKFSSSDICKCIWRKPFISDPESEPFDEEYNRTEWKYVLYEIASLMQDQGKFKLNFPMPDFMFGKVMQQRVAKKYFNIAPSEVAINKVPQTAGGYIAKSLSSVPFSNGKVLYTVDVSDKELSPDIWFIQNKIISDFDVTVVFLYEQVFSFCLCRENLTTLDWRKDQFEPSMNWEPYPIEDSIKNVIIKYMNELGLVYGRLDFMLDKTSLELIFLEVNKNGQWAWLDPTFENGLFKAMCKIFDPIAD